MNLILKQILIITTAFLIVLWFQTQDDKKHNKIRNSFYDIYKFPILVASIVGFIIHIPAFFCSNESSFHTELTIITPIEENCDLAKPFIQSNNFGNNNNEPPTWFNKEASDQLVFTDLPDF